MTTPDTLRALAEELCEAKEGSRDLDAWARHQIHGDMHRCNFDEGCYCENAPDCCSEFPEPNGCGKWLGMHDERTSYPIDWRDDERLPHYTTSLDAKLPGEDIGCVYAPGFGTNRGAPGTYNAEKWHAVAVRRLGGGRLQLFRVEAHTEPLARRAAGLLAMAHLELAATVEEEA